MLRYRALCVCLAFVAASLQSGCGTCVSTCVQDREVFKLRPAAEDQYGYVHAIRVGDRLMISGAVSMDDQGRPTAVGDLSQQMRNCYADLGKVLEHFGCSFKDVVVENIYTTNMAEFLELSGFRTDVYGDQFPTGTWLEVNGLALPEFMIEIELEAHVPRR